jgi:hypothetical protein
MLPHFSAHFPKENTRTKIAKIKEMETDWLEQFELMLFIEDDSERNFGL